MKTDPAQPIDSGFDLPLAYSGAETVDLQAFGRMMEARQATAAGTRSTSSGRAAPLQPGAAAPGAPLQGAVSPSAEALSLSPELAMAFAAVALGCHAGLGNHLTQPECVALADWQRRAWQAEAGRDAHGATGTKTHTPYQTFWRERARLAEAELKRRDAESQRPQREEPTWNIWSMENDPERGVYVLAFTTWKTIERLQRDWRQGSNPDHWRDGHNCRWELRQVTHWMPFPPHPSSTSAPSAPLR